MHSVVNHDPKYMRLRLVAFAGLSLDMLKYTLDYIGRGGVQAPQVDLNLILFGPFAVVLLLYALSFILTRAGRLIGGVATPRGFRIVLRTSFIPAIAGFAVFILPHASAIAVGAYEKSPLHGLFSLSLWGYAISVLWSLVAGVHGIAEIQRFPTGKALMNGMLVIAVTLNAVLGAVLFLLAAILGAAAYAVFRPLWGQ